MSLIEEVKIRKKEFKTDGYPMSIGEIFSLYENEELIINPNFQRFFRWSSAQKSRLIESILLGIPIPAIFVYQRNDGVWELVDGLQRISTILEFAGKLKKSNGDSSPPLKLTGTKLLPSLENVCWEIKEAGESQDELPKSMQLDFKRSADSSTRCNKDEPGDGWLRMSRHHGRLNRQVQVARCTSTSAEKNDTKFTAS